MNTLADTIESETDRNARKEKIIKVDNKLNDIIVEQIKKGNKKAIVSVSGIVNKTGIHERTLRSIGFPGVYENNFESCEWKKWTGLVIELKDYAEETGLMQEKNLQKHFEHVEEQNE